MEELKSAIHSNNRKKIEEIILLHCQSLPTKKLTFSIDEVNRLEKDQLGSLLIPFDVPLPEHEVFAVKTLGNGNCLFNSASFLLCGSYDLANMLRILTAAELFTNAEKYAKHPKILEAFESPEITYSRNNLFTIILRDGPSSISDPIKAIEQEALLTCKDKQWSGMVDIMGLATVINRNIWSVYPDCNGNIRPLISGIVRPLSSSLTQGIQTIYIMWSRDGNMDNCHGRPYEPNHFIPLLFKPAHPEEINPEPEPQRKKRRVEVEGKKFIK